MELKRWIKKHEGKAAIIVFIVWMLLTFLFAGLISLVDPVYIGGVIAFLVIVLFFRLFIDKE